MIKRLRLKFVVINMRIVTIMRIWRRRASI